MRSDDLTLQLFQWYNEIREGQWAEFFQGTLYFGPQSHAVFTRWQSCSARSINSCFFFSFSALILRRLCSLHLHLNGKLYCKSNFIRKTGFKVIFWCKITFEVQILEVPCTYIKVNKCLVNTYSWQGKVPKST